MGLIEKWNMLSKKKISINGTLEVAVGRLVYVSIVTGVQILSMWLSGAAMPSLWFLFSNFIFALKQKEK